MSFEFLAPDQAREWEGARPPQRSPIEWAHRGEGAELSEIEGWSVVAGYGSPGAETAACLRTVGVADVSFLGKVELQGEPELVSTTVAELAGGAVLEPGRAALHEDVWWCPLTAGRVIAITPPEATAKVRDELFSAASSASSFASVVELTAGLGSNAVIGPLAREAFARTTALDLRPERFGEHAFAPVSVARTAGMVLRHRGDRFLHLFGAGFASYVWTVFIDAAESLGGRAVGLDAVLGSEHAGVAADA